MFGIIYTALMSLGFIGHQVKNAVKEQKNINKGIEKRRNGENFANVYTDYRGGLRSLETGKRVRIDQLYDVEAEGKDCYMRDIYGNPIRNLSEEIRQRNYIEAKKDPRRTVAKWKTGITESMARMEGNVYYAGETYKDLKSGNIYVCRNFPLPKEITTKHLYCNCYMSIDTGLLVRETDSQRYDRERGLYNVSEDIVNKFIEYFNMKQKDKGYQCLSNTPSLSGWDSSENDYVKRMRMVLFYCNNYKSTDTPRKGKL